MRGLRIAIRLLRYRAALVLALVELIAIASRDGLEHFGVREVLGIVLLGAGYIAATACNDLADVAIDVVNHQHNRGRPLVSGEAEPRDVRMIAILSGLLALALAAVVGPGVVVIAAAGVAILCAYSLPPFRLSRHPACTPVALTIGYVGVPFAVGLAATADTAYTTADLRLGAALMLLFLARISLKDFRDREGDARAGKATLLSVRGKGFVCWVSFTSLLVGDLMLVLAAPSAAFAISAQVYVVTAMVALGRLAAASALDDELFAIGCGAKVGNGLLLCLLAAESLHAAAAPERDIALVIGGVTVCFAVSLALVLDDPGYALQGYRG